MRFIVLCLFFTALVAEAKEISKEKSWGPTDLRMVNRWGVYLGIHDPHPAMPGLGVAYHLASFLRTSLGIGLTAGQNGQRASGTTLGGSFKFLLPTQNSSPLIGFGFAHLFVDGSGTYDLFGFSKAGNHVYLVLGYDWTLSSGLNFGVGYIRSLREGVHDPFNFWFGWYF